MTKKETRCGFCGEPLGTTHGYLRPYLIKDHFKAKHPEELMEIQEKARELSVILKNYSYPMESIYFLA